MEGLKESERIEGIRGLKKKYVAASLPTGRISPDRPGGNSSLVFFFAFSDLSPTEICLRAQPGGFRPTRPGGIFVLQNFSVL